MRTVGVEEELLLVDGQTGRPRAVAAQVVHASLARSNGEQGESDHGELGHELQAQQIETDTAPRTTMAEIEDDLRGWRATAIERARGAGAKVIAAGTSPVAGDPQLVHDARYERLAERYGVTAHEQMACACHVHVSVESDEEGVGVLDRIRPWLPVLIALSASSPFYQGTETGYASFRSQLMVRWPTAGPYEPFGSAAGYHARVEAMVASGVPLDEGMIYFDARLARNYPTVEIRVADVCPDVRDTVLIAALCRALVDTAARDWTAGMPTPQVSTAMLRVANWQASRDGVDGELLDLEIGRPRPAREVVERLLEHLGPALCDNDDQTIVREGLQRVLASGTGASRQRAILGKTGQLLDVVADLARLTAGQDG